MASAVKKKATKKNTVTASRKTTLLELSLQHHDLMELFVIDEDTGEILEDPELERKHIDGLTANKVDAIGDLIAMKEDMVLGFKQAIKREEREMERLYSLIKRAADIRPEIAKLGHRRRFRKTLRVAIDDVSAIPSLFARYEATDMDRFFYWASQMLEKTISNMSDLTAEDHQALQSKIKYVADKAAIKKALAEGQTVTGARLENNYTLMKNKGE